MLIAYVLFSLCSGRRHSTNEEETGLTQEELAERLKTRKSAISRIENHAGDIRLSTLERYARAVGRQRSLELGPKPRRAPAAK